MKLLRVGGDVLSRVLTMVKSGVLGFVLCGQGLVSLNSIEILYPSKLTTLKLKKRSLRRSSCPTVFSRVRELQIRFTDIFIFITESSKKRRGQRGLRLGPTNFEP